MTDESILKIVGGQVAGGTARKTSVVVDPAQLKSVHDLLANLQFRGHSAAAVALQTAVSRTVTTGTARVARVIGEQVNLPIKEIKSVIEGKRGSYDDPSGSITVTRRSVALVKYLTGAQRNSAARRFAQGLRFRRPAGGLTISVRRRAQPNYPTTETIPGAFLAVVGGSHLGIFKRIGKKRLPIRELRGPSPLGVFLNALGARGRSLIDETVDDLGEVLQKNVESQLDRFLK